MATKKLSGKMSYMIIIFNQLERGQGTSQACCLSRGREKKKKSS
jgi:hypothetical protein